MSDINNYNGTVSHDKVKQGYYNGYDINGIKKEPTYNGYAFKIRITRVVIEPSTGYRDARCVYEHHHIMVNNQEDLLDIYRCFKHVDVGYKKDLIRKTKNYRTYLPSFEGEVLHSKVLKTKPKAKKAIVIDLTKPIQLVLNKWDKMTKIGETEALQYVHNKTNDELIDTEVSAVISGTSVDNLLIKLSCTNVNHYLHGLELQKNVNLDDTKDGEWFYRKGSGSRELSTFKRFKTNKSKINVTAVLFKLDWCLTLNFMPI